MDYTLYFVTTQSKTFWNKYLFSVSCVAKTLCYYPLQPSHISCRVFIQAWDGNTLLQLCCSRKYPYSPHGGFFGLNPLHPSGNSSLGRYFLSKILAFKIPPSPRNFCGGGVDFFWNHPICTWDKLATCSWLKPSYELTLLKTQFNADWRDKSVASPWLGWGFGKSLPWANLGSCELSSFRGSWAVDLGCYPAWAQLIIHVPLESPFHPNPINLWAEADFLHFPSIWSITPAIRSSKFFALSIKGGHLLFLFMRLSQQF